jgi:hypothetical protein
MIANKDHQLSEAIKLTQRAKTLVESKEREIRIIKESNVRQNTMEDLLAPLNEEKRETMRNLLESVQTARLNAAFEKYLPAVLAEGKSTSSRKVIVENVSEVTGDKTARSQVEDNADDNSNVIAIKRLAGL